jgi:hypothetical protein
MRNGSQDAWRRPDIPLHALAMLKNEREEGIVPNKPGEIGPLDQLQALKDKNPGIPPMCRTSKPEVLALEVKSRQFSIVSSCFVT